MKGGLLNKRKMYGLLTLLVVLVGTGLRLYDLTEPPLDFYPTRQFRSLILARAFYLHWRPGSITQEEAEQRAAANRIARYEPPLLEKLVARTYLLLGREEPWVIRGYNAAFWLLGALGVALLVRLWEPHPAALLAALGYWMLLPFNVHVTRAFLPDPLMTVLLVWAVYAWYRWSRGGSSFWLLPAAVLGSMAAVVKIYALFFLGPIPLLLAWARGKRPWHPAWWWLAMLAPVAIALPFYLNLHSPEYAGHFLLAWTLKLRRWWLSPMPYGGWMEMVNNALHGGWVLVGLLALFLEGRTRNRAALVVGWLLGYALYGAVFLIQFATHAYYHLPLVPLVALGLGLGLHRALQVLETRSRPWQAAGMFLLSTALVYPAGITYWHLASVDYRAKAEVYRRMGETLPRDGKIMALTEAYGWPLLYYGNVNVVRWPTQAHHLLFGVWDESFERTFRERTQGFDYFLVTDFEEFWRQAPLRSYLFEHYPLIHQGGDYLLWDLRQPKSP